jgi:hypothetical protein
MFAFVHRKNDLDNTANAMTAPNVNNASAPVDIKDCNN